MTRYVQHMSGQGEKLRIMPESLGYGAKDIKWFVHDAKGELFMLPKSDYQEVPPPKGWTDITVHCDMVNGGQFLAHQVGNIAHPIFDDKGFLNIGYRLRKVLIAGMAVFLIEHLEAPK